MLCAPWLNMVEYPEGGCFVSVYGKSCNCPRTESANFAVISVISYTVSLVTVTEK